MCVTATVAAVVSATAAVGGTVASIGAAKANAAQQKIALQMEQKALNEQRRIAKLQAMEAEAERVREYNQLRAANLAALAATGTRSESFLQGIEPASRRALAFDLRNIRMGAVAQDAAALRGIRVNRMTQQAVNISSGLQQFGAVASGLSGLASAAGTYGQYRTPTTTSKTVPDMRA